MSRAAARKHSRGPGPPSVAAGSVDQEPRVWRGACGSHPALWIQWEERADRPQLLAGLWRPGPFRGITALRGARGGWGLVTWTAFLGAGVFIVGRSGLRCSGHVVCLEERHQGDTVGRASPLPPRPEAFAQCRSRTRPPLCHMFACAPRGPPWAPPRPASRKRVFAERRTSQS